MKDIYLITGAAGHLGNTIIRKLVERGEYIRALVLPGEKVPVEGDIEVFYGDVRDMDSLRPFMEVGDGYNVILIHCAGIVSIASKYQQKVYETNVLGTKNIVELAIENKVDKFIYVSSVHAITEKPKGQLMEEISDFNPELVVGAYAKTKAEATKFVLDSIARGLKAIVVHPSGICGPYDYGKGHSTKLVMDYYNRKLTSAAGGGYDFVDVRDVADGILASCQRGRIGECYILSNKFVTALELLRLLHEITGHKEIKRVLPLWFLTLTAKMAEMYYKILGQAPLFTAYSIYTLNSNAKFSHEKATRELGYKTRELKETLGDTVDWLISQGRIK